MSEATIRAVCGNLGLGESPSHDYAPVDRLHALGKAQMAETYKDSTNASARAFLASLGRDLHTLINGNTDRWKWRCEIGLAQAVSWPEHGLSLEPHEAVSIAIQALREIRDEKCRECHGRTDENGVFSIPDIDRMGGITEWTGPVPLKMCPACGGIGKHRWNNYERSGVVRNAAAMERAFVIAHGLIGQAMREAMSTASYLLR